MQRTRVVWSGWQGAPGYTNLFSRVADQQQHDYEAHATAVAAFFSALSNRLPPAVTLRIDPEVAVIEDTTGEIQSFHQLTSIPTIVGGSGSAGNFAAPAGAAVDWVTDGIREGRRVIGRTFLVPLRTNVFEDDGTLAAAAIADISAAASAYADNAPAPVVWSRPRPGREGSSHSVTGSRVRDQAVVLRTRRA